jgi:hypothetical protein
VSVRVRRRQKERAQHEEQEAAIAAKFETGMNQAEIDAHKAVLSNVDATLDAVRGREEFQTATLKAMGSSSNPTPPVPEAPTIPNAPPSEASNVPRCFGGNR